MSMILFSISLFKITLSPTTATILSAIIFLGWLFCAIDADTNTKGVIKKSK